MRKTISKDLDSNLVEEKKTLFIIFGGSGDLARRKLYPALFRLFLAGTLNEHFAVIGTSRRSWPDEYYQNIVLDSIAKVNGATQDDRQNFAKHFFYQANDVTDVGHYKVLKHRAREIAQKFQIDGPWLYYLAMAPTLFGTITENLARCEFLENSHPNRLVIEKPFGHDYLSAKTLNEEIQKAFPEKDIYRIDHYLGKEIVQNIVPFRFSNPLIKSIWNSKFISNIQITLAEKVGVEERAGYYEQAGALRDMFQNHISQLMMLSSMEEPVSLEANDFVEQKYRVLASLKPLNQQDLLNNFVRGQYCASKEMPGYREEAGVDPKSNVETFVAGKLELQTPSLKGVPIYFRTGKRLKEKETRIDVVFKAPETGPYLDAKNNVLTIFIDPSSGISLKYNAKSIGDTKILSHFEMQRLYTEEERHQMPEAYQRLFHDVLNGDKTNFVQWEELCASWKLTDQIVNYWHQQPLADSEFYAAGSLGPRSANDLLANDHNYWIYQG
ncbi:glucose-6-phosphate dehydrogenase [Xylocopilactobacillus apicola]|uniref:Glucose-6-phosphate 1-dehydrogenase n=1 Tax=Xylocopilactobacillus apicola TaxID=2932184 RepID=A0AAU9DP00_9LACO|nr:glucose-6-phosphate dehydrogenase [Xylocopilactobacillus apicola]BDR58842.1 glucose-6-phosphate 1-dehydrogenase [Xylocopilactobacillus apicola]